MIELLLVALLILKWSRSAFTSMILLWFRVSTH